MGNSSQKRLAGASLRRAQNEGVWPSSCGQREQSGTQIPIIAGLFLPLDRTGESLWPAQRQLPGIPSRDPPGQSISEEESPSVLSPPHSPWQLQPTQPHCPLLPARGGQGYKGSNPISPHVGWGVGGVGGSLTLLEPFQAPTPSVKTEPNLKGCDWTWVPEASTLPS